MSRAAALLLGMALTFAVWGAASCYDPNKPPPCHPGTIDYPRCIDPTQPRMVRDGGADR